MVKMGDSVTVYLNLRRFDLYECPPNELRRINLKRNSDYEALKEQIQNICDVDQEDDKVIKVRNKNLVLMPITYLLEGSTESNPYIIDVSRVNYKDQSSTSSLQDAHLNAVCKNLRTLESRVAQAELLVPQLRWRRQANMEQTVNTLSSRVAFLNKRIDDLMPPQWKSKIPQTLS